MDLAKLRGGTEPIRVGVVGIGRIGQGVVDQVSPFGVCGCCCRQIRLQLGMWLRSRDSNPEPCG
jgi:predicted homoserine dehydrogenase-like protein